MSVPPQGAAAWHVREFSLRQRIEMTANTYELFVTHPDGSDGQLLAFAQQKRMAFKEKVTFYTDAAKAQAVFSFRARKTLDLGSGYDVFDANEEPIGWFKKQFGKSLLRSSWRLGAEGLEAAGEERSVPVAIVRRIWDFFPMIAAIPVPLVFHFDFTDTKTGTQVLSVERRFSVRDRYRAIAHDGRLDFRVAAAMTVALDALQGR